MTVKANVDLRKVQEQVGDTTKHARRLGRKVVLASLGLVGMTYDTGKSLVHHAEEFVAKAEHRGEEIEEAFNAKVQEVQDQVTTEIKERRTQIETKIDGVSKEVSERGKSVEDTVQKAFSRLKVGDSGGDSNADGEIEIEVEAEIDVEVSEEIEAAESQPIDGYDEMTAHEVVAALPDLDPETVERVRVYEAAHKDRVTIIREIEELTAASATTEAQEPPA